MVYEQNCVNTWLINAQDAGICSQVRLLSITHHSEFNRGTGFNCSITNHHRLQIAGNLRIRPPLLSFYHHKMAR